MDKERILVGMSGGIDSSAACKLLREAGYEVVGATLRMWDRHGKEASFIDDARRLAMRLGMEHYTVDIRDEFNEKVIRPFIDEYMNGRTPNPCVFCNPDIKWKHLIEEADRHGCRKIATGHYVRKVEDASGIWIEEGRDKSKDQSYFLWGLSREQLERTLFPLGDYTKREIKEMMAGEAAYEKKEKKESMEICFIEDDYRTFLRQAVPDIDARMSGGYYVDNKGLRLGRHEGYPFYTVGQRKGLGIALGEPAYVIKINPAKNTVKLGRREELTSCAMKIARCEIRDMELLRSPEARVCIRYRGEKYAIRSITEGENELTVEFADGATAVAPGQSAVFYIGERVVGGGIITYAQPTKK